MSVVGVTPEWSAKDLLAHLAYWERAAAEEIREFEAGRSPAKKRKRGQMERINREVVSANRATPRQRLREELILARSEIVAAMKRAARGTRRKVSARSDRLLSLPAAQGASSGTASRLGCKSWQDIVNEKESPRERGSVQRKHSWRPEVRREKLVDLRAANGCQPNSTARTTGQGLLTSRRTIRFWMRWPGVFGSFRDSLRRWTSVPPRSKETSSMANFIKWMPRPCSASRFSIARGSGTVLGSNPFP